jgi:tetrahydromethanopterin S-methyltransferase subunit G
VIEAELEVSTLKGDLDGVEKEIKSLDELDKKLKYSDNIITDEEAGRRVGLMIGIILGLTGAVVTSLYIYKKRNREGDFHEGGQDDFF